MVDRWGACEKGEMYIPKRASGWLDACWTKERHLSVSEPFLLYIYLSQFSNWLYALEREHSNTNYNPFWECNVKSLWSYNGKELEHRQLDLWLIHIVAGSSQEDVWVKTEHMSQYTQNYT